MKLLAQEVQRMLELRQSSAVPQWAAARLAALCEARAYRVLRVFPIAAAREAAAARGHAIAPDGPVIDVLPVPASADPDLADAIARRCVLCTAGEARLLLPLCAGDEVRHLLELERPHGASPGRALALELIPLIAAYYDLLAEAEIDPLTRLANRRLFYSQVGAGMTRRAPGSRKRYLALADIDDFKQVNDRFGHLYGDEILIHFARLMRETFRAGDLLYRFGGEEFLIVYAVDRDQERYLALERFRAAVERYEFPRIGRVTASVGFTALEGALVPATTFVDRADNAVYFAKRNGRNRVCEYEDLVARGALRVPQPESGGEATLF